MLIVPDTRTRSYLRAQLIHEGYEVRAFKTIEDARRWIYIGGRVPTLVLVDVWRTTLPEGSVKWLRQISDRSPILFISGSRDRALPELEEIGETIHRPISVSDIVRAIRAKT